MGSAPDSAPKNPLLELRGGPPPFERFRTEHVVPGIETLLAELSSELDALEAGATPTWEGLVEPLERIADRLSQAWGLVSHFMSVRNNDELRKAYETVQPKVVSFYLRFGQSRVIFENLQGLRDGDAWSSLNPTQQRIVAFLLRDARHAGVGLQGEARARFNEIEQQLAELTTKFSNNVLDATKAYALTLRSKDGVEGLPPSLLELTAQAAARAGEEAATADEGPWRITLDGPVFFPFLEHARRGDLREKVYRAYMTRASVGDQDNAPLMSSILKLRQEQAKLLGFDSYASLSLDRKMARNADEVARLLEEVRSVAFEAAKQDMAALRALAKEREGTDDLKHWDVAFWAERLREERYRYSEEEVRPYLPFPRVLDGLFALASRLFGVEIVAADGEVTLWHDDVRFFRVRDEEGREMASFYLDPYSRPGEKRGGAWMSDTVGRSRLLAPSGRDVRLPIAYLCCNQTPPVGDRPSLMTWDEVETLFHEFGHGLQHMLTRIDLGFAAGIENIEWDAVELPSQFMENWCHHRETVRGFSGHWQTGAPLPDELFNKVDAARTYRAGSRLSRQIQFGLTDMALHSDFDPDGELTPFDVMRQIGEKTSVLPALPEERFLCSFTHIFAGGYAAGYYSYLWAQVLSADAFSAFEDAGLEDDAALRGTGKRYRETILALGSSRSPAEVFEAFRGRPPSTEALLRHQGLLADSGR